MPTCMQKILQLNKHLFHSKETESNENLECPNNEPDTLPAGLTPAFHQYLQVAAWPALAVC